MTEFKRIPANKRSIACRQLVNGVGVNDAWYITSAVYNGKVDRCPIYMKWKAMLARCYVDKYALKNSTYINCIVSDEWLIFSNFLKWMDSQEWAGKELDKDIIKPGNKIYSKETCMFIPHDINVLITYDKGAKTPGVHIRNNRYKMRICENGRTKRRTFKTENEAVNAYYEEKSKRLIRAAFEINDNRIMTGLCRHAAECIGRIN